MRSTSQSGSKNTSKKRTVHRGKWVWCYLPSINSRVKILDETRAHWIVDHPKKMVVKCACSSTPTTKEKAVRNPRGKIHQAAYDS